MFSYTLFGTLTGRLINSLSLRAFLFFKEKKRVFEKYVVYLYRYFIVNFSGGTFNFRKIFKNLKDKKIGGKENVKWKKSK